MNYALSYSIPRAVMYDNKINIGNPKYDLNRHLIKEDKNIIVISRDNIQESLKSILSAQAESSKKDWVQNDMFE
jgi:DNA processing protein